MSWAVVASIIVALGFLALTCYVFAPRNKQYFNDMAQIPLADDPPPDLRCQQGVVQGETLHVH